MKKKKNDKWYYVCYDSQGDGFKSIPAPYCYAFGKKELECAISYATEECEIAAKQVCIFKLTKKKCQQKQIIANERLHRRRQGRPYLKQNHE